MGLTDIRRPRPEGGPGFPESETGLGHTPIHNSSALKNPKYNDNYLNIMDYIA